MAQNDLHVYVRDSDTVTNLRNGPKGDVVGHVHNFDMLVLDSCANGWFHIKMIYFNPGEEVSEERIVKDDNLWIHNSVITADWVGDGASRVISFRQAPADSAKVILKDKCGKHLIARILDLQGDWAKVRTSSGFVGWVPIELICGNSLTNCC